MIEQIEIAISPELVNDEDTIRTKIKKKTNVSQSKHWNYIIKKRSLDARGRNPLYRLRIEVYLDESLPERIPYQSTISRVNTEKKVIIIGAGPAGYFAALTCIEKGIKPIVLERGKDVRARRRDLKAIQQDHTVNPHSNYCFGEGGAGTYSDGKLYTRSHKRGNIQSILEILVDHGAKSDILVDAHPHIGSNKLPGIISNMRQTIEEFGGEVHFDSWITDLNIDGGQFRSAITDDGKVYHGDALILATGHSARDIYTMLDRLGVSIEAKPFALGVRIEHPQPLIDEIRYGKGQRERGLPAASYSLVCNINQKGVFSFCMCPGGLIVPAATEPGEIVVNGMSLSRRDSPFANSGIVTAIDQDDVQPLGFSGPFAYLDYQKSIEQKLFNYGDGSQQAPALRMTDFVNGKLSSDLNQSSYIPGVYSAPLFDLLPSIVYERLKIGLQQMGKQLKGYYTAEANIVATESRTSSTIRIPRNPSTLMHDDITGLFPCGEGAGYAGGIISAAMDGQRVGNQVFAYFFEKK